MKPKKIHVNLPLKIPQNIYDVLEEYRQWRITGVGNKEEIRTKLSKIARRWHLYAGYSAMAGSFFIETTVGISIVCHIDEDEPLELIQYTDYNVWGTDNDKTWVREKTDGDKTFVYHWDEQKSKKKDLGTIGAGIPTQTR